MKIAAFGDSDSQLHKAPMSFRRRSMLQGKKFFYISDVCTFISIFNKIICIVIQTNLYVEKWLSVRFCSKNAELL